MKSLLKFLLAALTVTAQETDTEVEQVKSVDILGGKGIFTTNEAFLADWNIVQDAESTVYTYNVENSVTETDEGEIEEQVLTVSKRYSAKMDYDDGVFLKFENS